MIEAAAERFQPLFSFLIKFGLPNYFPLLGYNIMVNQFQLYQYSAIFS
jgi:hypothetical protein